jgi:hypothetical protein
MPEEKEKSNVAKPIIEIPTKSRKNSNVVTSNAELTDRNMAIFSSDCSNTQYLNRYVTLKTRVFLVATKGINNIGERHNGCWGRSPTLGRVLSGLNSQLNTRPIGQNRCRSTMDRKRSLGKRRLRLTGNIYVHEARSILN